MHCLSKCSYIAVHNMHVCKWVISCTCIVWIKCLCVSVTWVSGWVHHFTCTYIAVCVYIHRCVWGSELECVTVCVHVGTVVFILWIMTHNGFQFICVLGEHEQQVVEMRRLDWSEASCHNWARSVDYVIATGTVTKRKSRISIVLLSWSS